MFNRSVSGHSFSDEMVRKVWAKGRIVPGYDPRYVRKDCCGAWISWSEYGKQTESGWEIDHIRPVSANGSDDLSCSSSDLI
jgi:hypothetical protein